MRRTVPGIRLTATVAAAGCAAKIGPGDLRAALASLRQPPRDRRVLVDAATLDDAGIFALRRHCLLRGITVTGGAVRNDFCNPAAVAASLEHVRLWIGRYALLGAPVIRIFAGEPVAGEPLGVTLDRCAAACTESCRHAADRGIVHIGRAHV